MNNETAKVILSAYRPGGTDARDPTFAGALEQARLDPQLARWFEEQRAFDQDVFRELQSIKAPASVRDFLLARMRVAEPPSRSRLWIPWLAFAAVLLINAVLLVRPLRVNRRGDALGVFEKDALAMLSVQPGPKLDLLTPSLPETQAYIAREQGPVAPSLPPVLRGLSTAGCRVTEWHHHRMSLTCFQTPGGSLVHLIVLLKSALVRARLPSGFETINGWHVAYREQNGMVMFLATRAPMDEFQKVLQS